jgi:hypothetical protein
LYNLDIAGVQAEAGRGAWAVQAWPYLIYGSLVTVSP